MKLWLALSPIINHRLNKTESSSVKYMRQNQFKIKFIRIVYYATMLYQANYINSEVIYISYSKLPILIPF